MRARTRAGGFETNDELDCDDHDPTRPSLPSCLALEPCPPRGVSPNRTSSNSNSSSSSLQLLVNLQPSVPVAVRHLATHFVRPFNLPPLSTVSLWLWYGRVRATTAATTATARKPHVWRSRWNEQHGYDGDGFWCVLSLYFTRLLSSLVLAAHVGAFGSNNQQSGGVFGQPKPATGFGAFGGGGGATFGSTGNTSTFGSTPGTGAFGSTPNPSNTSGGIFGQPSTSTNTFGSGGGIFGQNKPATPFGATNSTSVPFRNTPGQDTIQQVLLCVRDLITCHYHVEHYVPRRCCCGSFGP